MPFDGKKIDRDRLIEVARDLLVTLGEDPEREGLKETPRRFADAWIEFLNHDPGRTDTAFEHKADQLVVLHDIHLWSMCEHHLLPFDCTIAIGYIARKKVLGISKLGRIAQQMAHRLQLQERLCEMIADECEKMTGTDDIAVLATGTHLCLAMRGAKLNDARMSTSVMRGRFREGGVARDEFLRIALGR